MNILIKIWEKLRSTILVYKNAKRFYSDVNVHFGSNIIDVLMYTYWNKLSQSDKSIVSKIENLRIQTRSNNRTNIVESYASPRSNEVLFDDDGNVRAGKINLSTNGSFARTGSGPKTGIQLKKISEAFQTKRILELGTNTGLSGCYFLEAKNKPELVTIEGSKQLCEIADKNLKSVSSNYKIINGMFDQVLDDLIEKKDKFDMAFVDGQHEEKATLFYAEKLKQIVKPGGIILFDDIFWSEGMNRSWNQIKSDKAYDLAIGLRTRGFVRLSSDDVVDAKQFFELTDYIGRPRFARKNH